MKLRVLAGAKQGTEIPLKKEKFIIGRASDCTLRAGSEAISRRHCVLLRTDKGVVARDLGSRNGTYVNDQRISGDVSLGNGDRVRVGPLEFVFEAAVDLVHGKKPKVKDVADAVERTAQINDSAIIEEDDISRWLLGPGPDGEESPNDRAMRETQTFRMDETHAMLSKAAEQAATITDDVIAEEASGESSDSDEEEASDSKKKGKKQPGKLPKLPPKPQSKDSREAAADILRELARRR